MRELLDDSGALLEGDPRGMLAAFASTGRQLEASYEGARTAAVPFASDIRSVTFCGMGGSAAAGDVVAAAFADRVSVPMLTLRGYRVPGGYGPDDLVVCVSYSGNTEETISGFAAARERGCRTIAVCGGGVLAERAREASTPVVLVPDDAAVPRAGLGALVGSLLGALVGTGALSGVEADVLTVGQALSSMARELAPAVPTDRNEAKNVAEWVGERLPVIWGSEGVSTPAAWRWKTAFNENAEIPAFASALPELDHHEVVGWTGKRGQDFCLVILREDGEHQSVQARLDVTLEEMSDSGLEWREVRARGDTPLVRYLSLAMVGDLASSYHALARGIDPASMDSLTRLKERLAKDRR